MKTLSISTAIMSLIVLSCAKYQGSLTSSAAITNENFTIVSTASGKSTSKYYLGMGGLNHSGMILDAKRNMEKSFPLRKGQLYANIAIDFKNSFYLIYQKQTVIISADIVQFGSKNPDEIESILPTSQTPTIKEKIDSLPIGPINVQNITFQAKEKVLVKVRFNQFKSMTISTKHKKRYEFKEMKISEDTPYYRNQRTLFKDTGTYLVNNFGKLTVGDTIKMTYIDVNAPVKAKVLGLGSKFFVAEMYVKPNGKSITRSMSYSKIVK